MRSATIQIWLRKCEFSLDAFWMFKDAKYSHPGNEGSDQTMRMRRLIWIFLGRTCEKVRFFHIAAKTDACVSFGIYINYQSKSATTNRCSFLLDLLCKLWF